MQKDCIILAGGLGTRLQSVVSEQPKCLADIAGKPFLYYLCNYLQPFQLNKVVFSVGYKKDMVIEFMNQVKNQFNFQIAFAEETEPLGTGGAVLNALEYCDTEDFFVLNGDTLFDVDLNALLDWQQTRMADCTLSLKPMSNADRYGMVSLNEDHIITAFQEKKENSSGYINGGVYCLFRNSFLNIPFEKKFFFEKDYLEKYLYEREITGWVQDKYFIDIGIPTDYQKAQTEIPNLFQES